MIRSTPVSDSIARMLRPSRPMIRPFISSLGSSISRVVVSLAWVPASRPIAIERMLRARRSASRLVSSSICEQDPAGLAAGVVFDVGDQHLLGLRWRSGRRAARAPCAGPASGASAPRPGPRDCARGRRGRARGARSRRAAGGPPRHRGGPAPGAGRSPRGGPAGRPRPPPPRPRRRGRGRTGRRASRIGSRERLGSAGRSRLASFLLPRRSIPVDGSASRAGAEPIRQRADPLPPARRTAS